MGMYRRGRSRPTFDTEVTFIPINRTAPDLPRGLEDGPANPNRPGNVKLMADVKDVAAREAPVGAVQVAMRTKSLIFAQAAVAPLMATGRLSKEWKVSIAGREMDVVSVLDDWAPGLYARIIVEERE